VTQLLGIGAVLRFVAGLRNPLERLEIRPGREVAAGAGENDGAHVRIRRGPFEGLGEGDDHRRRQGIRSVGIVEGEDEDRAIPFFDNWLLHAPILHRDQSAARR